FVAAPGAAEAARLPAQIWAIQLPGGKATVTPRYLRALKATGVNALIVDVGAFPAAKAAATGAAARRVGGLTLLLGHLPGKSCPSWLGASAVCTLKAGSAAVAVKLARPGAPPVVVGIGRLSELAALGHAKGRLVAVVPYRLTANEDAWSRA